MTGWAKACPFTWVAIADVFQVSSDRRVAVDDDLKNVGVEIPFPQ